MKLLSSHMALRGSKVGLYPRADPEVQKFGESIQALSSYFNQSVVYFDTDAEFTNYCSDVKYGDIQEGFPPIEFGIHFTSLQPPK